MTSHKRSRGNSPLTLDSSIPDNLPPLKKHRDILTSEAQPATPPESATEVESGVLNDGLPDVENVDASVENIVLRDAGELHLLRLPAELRNLIWKFYFEAQDGHRRIIISTSRSYSANYAAPKWSLDFKVTLSTKEREALEFSRTCRQIYDEVSTLFFSTRTFAFTDPSGGLFGRPTRIPREFAGTLNPAHKNAITSIVPNWALYNMYKEEKSTFRFRDTFPDLNTIIIPWHYINGRRDFRSAHEESLNQLAQQKEGNKVKVLVQ